MIVLDTNVVSEVVKPAPAETVLAWLAGQPPSQLFITTITQAEILYGLELMPKGKRRVALGAALEAMFAEDFAGRILSFDSEAARMYAQIAASRRARGVPSRNRTQKLLRSREHGARRWRLAIQRILSIAES